MASYDTTAMVWVANTTGRSKKAVPKGNPGPGYSRGRMYAVGDRILSYGEHFEIARLIRDKKSEPLFFLVNGDRWGNTTAKQQAAVRSAISYNQTPSVIIPFTVLGEAGIDFDSVRIVDVTRDRHEEIVDRTTELPAGVRWMQDDLLVSYAKYADLDKDGNVWVDRVANPYDLPRKDWFGLGFKQLQRLREEDEAARGKRYRVEVEPAVYRKGDWRLGTTRGGYTTWAAEQQADGSYVYTRTHWRHWLGESLISGDVIFTRRVKCPTCRGKGRAAEPWQESWAVREYEKRLADWEEFHEDWEARKFPVSKPTPPPFLTRCPECGGAGTRTAGQGRRRAFFLSGFDANESRPSYFFCELPPKSKPSTVAEAYEVLKPDAVRLAEQVGREVKRQGDVFAIETRFTKRDLRKLGATFTKQANILGTNHAASEVALLKDGTTLVRGTLKHVPEFRNPDHKRVTLGKGYFVVAKNTVPVGR